MTDHPQPALKHQKEIEYHPTAGLRCCLLGGFRLQRGEKTLPGENIRLRKARDLLKLLALAPDHRMHREQLLELLWPERAPDAAGHSLSQTLYTLRPRLSELDPSARVQFEDECLVLSAEGGVSTDLEEFEQAARQALGQMDPISSQAAALCQGAILAYTGDLLPEDGPSDLFGYRREELRQFYIDLLLQLADYNLEMEEYLPAIDTLHKALAADLAHEGAHTRLMRAYALNGQRLAALRQYQSLEEALRRDLDVAPAPESQELREQISSGELAARLPSFEWVRMAHHNLPAQMSSFIGRECEVGEVRELAQANRLVTLSGAGGVGKTRLALKVAEGLLDEFAQGVFWVELAPLSNPEMVTREVLEVFRLPKVEGLSDTERLVDFLKDQRLLLLLDNCEHLLSGCTTLAAALLKACPDLHILVTSRVRLNLPGEVTYRVPSLSVPDPAQMDSVPEISQFDAVRLFSERAGSHIQGFALNGANAPAVAHICRRLDGIPLALELAAARSRMMTVEQIAERLSDAFRLLVGGSQAVLPRHRTLKAVIDWSYELLIPQERNLLQRLSVFAGGWTLEAAESVCADGEIEGRSTAYPGGLEKAQMVDLLSGLVDKSLVQFDPSASAEPRYRMLETVRQYARERLAECGGEETVRARHLDYFLLLGKQAEPHLRARQAKSWMDRLDRELDNLRQALAWARSTSIVKGLQLATALWWFWWAHSHREIEEWLEGLLCKAREQFDFQGLDLTGKVILGRAINTLNFFISQDFALTTDRIDQLKQAAYLDSQAIFRELGQVYQLDFAIACFLRAQTVEEFQACRELFQAAHDPFWMAECDMRLTDLFAPEDEMAAFYCEANLALRKEIGDLSGQADALFSLGYIYLCQGNSDRAVELSLEAQACYEIVGNRWRIGMIHAGFASFFISFGKYQQSIQRSESLLAIAQELNDPWLLFLYPVHRAWSSWAMKEYEQALDYCHEALELGRNYPVEKKLFVYYLMCRVYLSQGDMIKARGHLNIFFTLEHFWVDSNVSYRGIQALGIMAVRQGQMEQAATWFGAQEELFGEHDWLWMFLSPPERAEFKQALADTRAALGEDAFKAAWQAGRAMTVEQVVAFALEPAG